MLISTSTVCAQFLNKKLQRVNILLKTENKLKHTQAYSNTLKHTQAHSNILKHTQAHCAVSYYDKYLNLNLHFLCLSMHQLNIG